MKLFDTIRRRKPQHLRMLVAGVCVLLILFIGAAQLLHTHSAEEGVNPGCSLCAVAHLSVLPVPALSPFLCALLILRPPQPVAAHAPPHFLAFSLYVRPPPVLTTLS